jgi:hypothetical protein
VMCLEKGGRSGLQQTQFAGTSDRLGTPMDLKFAKDMLDVSFHRIRSKDESLTHFLVRESLGNEMEDFSFAGTEELGNRERTLVLRYLH